MRPPPLLPPLPVAPLLFRLLLQLPNSLLRNPREVLLLAVEPAQNMLRRWRSRVWQ
jgi:hypothetical protein